MEISELKQQLRKHVANWIETNGIPETQYSECKLGTPCRDGQSYTLDMKTGKIVQYTMGIDMYRYEPGSSRWIELFKTFPDKRDLFEQILGFDLLEWIEECDGEIMEIEREQKHQPHYLVK